MKHKHTFRHCKTSLYKSKNTGYLRPGSDAYKNIPSLDSKACETQRQQKKSYSGDAILGIATMHKSNAIPITNGDMAKAVSKMRRG